MFEPTAPADVRLGPLLTHVREANDRLVVPLDDVNTPHRLSATARARRRRWSHLNNATRAKIKFDSLGPTVDMRFTYINGKTVGPARRVKIRH